MITFIILGITLLVFGVLGYLERKRRRQVMVQRIPTKTYKNRIVVDKNKVHYGAIIQDRYEVDTTGNHIPVVALTKLAFEREPRMEHHRDDIGASLTYIGEDGLIITENITDALADDIERRLEKVKEVAILYNSENDCFFVI